ncbi:hypothetical protein IV203_032261 [Nitzschia inconspicua]|uniref:Uncharacterized protein n=1 Tax=Nitzschia inconspicua TaxID=303405 RepID=A0A9K3KKD4_9STRA|nr:hypothetical protein IV203_032261 [Nitzschia inconspicua]
MVSFFQFIVTVSVFAISANAALVDEDHRTLGKSLPNPTAAPTEEEGPPNPTAAPTEEEGPPNPTAAPTEEEGTPNPTAAPTKGKGSKRKESPKSSKAPKGTKSPKMNGGKKGDDPCGPTPLCRIDFVSRTGMEMIAAADAAAAAAAATDEPVDARGGFFPEPIFGTTCNPCGPNGFMTNPGGILLDLDLPDIPGLDLPDAIEISCGCANVLGNLPVFDEFTCAILVDAVASAEGWEAERAAGSLLGTSSNRRKPKEARYCQKEVRSRPFSFLDEVHRRDGNTAAAAAAAASNTNGTERKSKPTSP